MDLEKNLVELYLDREYNRVASNGMNTGAVMNVYPVAGECCRVNVYVNTNVQGVTNSVLYGSEVIMRDPGVKVSRPGWYEDDIDDGRSHSQLNSVVERARSIGSILRWGQWILWFACLCYVILLLYCIWVLRAL